MRRILFLVAAVACLAAACSPGSSPSFTLTSASVDPTYFCPGGASDAHYDLHAAVQAHNGKSVAVTIKAVSAQLTLVSVTGDWLEKIGDGYDAGTLSFTPTDVAPGASTTLNLTIPSSCTSGKYGTGVSSAAEYRVTLSVTTSSGTFSIAAANKHEIVAA